MSMVPDGEMREAFERFLRLDQEILSRKTTMGVIRAEIRRLTAQRDKLSQELLNPPPLPLFDPDAPPSARERAQAVGLPVKTVQDRPSGVSHPSDGGIDVPGARPRPAGSQTPSEAGFPKPRRKRNSSKAPKGLDGRGS